MTDFADWRRALAADIQRLAPPPAGFEVRDIDEDRQARTGSHCRECGDTGPGVTIATTVTQTGTMTWTYQQAIFEGTLTDLLDRVADGTLTVQWERRTL